MSITQIIFENHRQEQLVLNLDNSDTQEGVQIYNFDGLGPPDASVVDGEAISDGDKFITCTLAIVVGALGNVRDHIAKFFQIKRDVKCTIISNLGTGTRYVDTVVEKFHSNQFAVTDNFEISLACKKPYFQDVTPTNVNIAYDGTIVGYQGDRDAGMTINFNINADISPLGLAISNNSDIQTMVLDFTQVLNEIYLAGQGPQVCRNGDYIIINTREGEKSAFYYRYGVPYNMLSGVSFSDDWLKLVYDIGFAPNTLTWDVGLPGWESNFSMSITYRNYWNLGGI